MDILDLKDSPKIFIK